MLAYSCTQLLLVPFTQPCRDTQDSTVCCVRELLLSGSLRRKSCYLRRGPSTGRAQLRAGPAAHSCRRPPLLRNLPQTAPPLAATAPTSCMTAPSSHPVVTRQLFVFPCQMCAAGIGLIGIQKVQKHNFGPDEHIRDAGYFKFDAIVEKSIPQLENIPSLIVTLALFARELLP